MRLDVLCPDLRAHINRLHELNTSEHGKPHDAALCAEREGREQDTSQQDTGQGLG